MSPIRRLMAWLTAQAGVDDHGAALVTCQACRAEAVVPVKWEDAGDAWWIAVRCGSCGARREVTLDDDDARAFDRALDRGMHRIARTAEVMERRRMRAAADALSAALERDLIGADDFAPRTFAS
jgi:hypothetical protein